MNYIKHTAMEFCKKHKLDGKEINYKQLLLAARQNGYIVNTYSGAAELLIFYNIYERSKKSSSVSITDKDQNTIIFIDDSIPKNKQRFALAHEIGHITLEHTPEKKTKRRQEYEADLFAHYLLIGTAPQKFGFVIALLSFLLCICIILITALLSFPLMEEVDFAEQNTNGEKFTSSAPSQIKEGISADNVIVGQPSASSSAPKTSSSSASSKSSSAEQSSDICYYTKYGTVYHIYRDCSYLKNSKKVYKSTINECPADRLCSRCADR